MKQLQTLLFKYLILTFLACFVQLPEKHSVYILYYVLIYTIYSIWVYGDFKDYWRNFGVLLVIAYVLGAEISNAKHPVRAVMVLNQYTYTGNGAARYAAFGGAFFALCQLPLDWDYDSVWQEFPIPFVIMTDLSHSVGLLVEYGIEKYARNKTD